MLLGGRGMKCEECNRNILYKTIERNDTFDFDQMKEAILDLNIRLRRIEYKRITNGI